MSRQDRRVHRPLLHALFLLPPGLPLLWAAPATAQAGGADPAQAEAPVRPVRSSWTADRAPLSVGDIVTILVDELTLAESNRDALTSRQRDRDAGLGFALDGPATSFGLSGRNDLRDRKRGEAARSDRFAAEISVRVVDVGPGGLARVEGTKTIEVDGHRQEILLRGWLRSNDVRPGNTIPSWRVADAELVYGSDGTLGESKGIWSKLLDFIVP